MTIRIRLFAILRDKAGKASFTLELPAGATVRAAVDQIRREYPAVDSHLGRCAFAVNQDYVSIDTPLKDNDELAIIPPVSGG